MFAVEILDFIQESGMKEDYIIAKRQHNASGVFSYECIPDKAVWGEEKYIGAEMHCFPDRTISSYELFKAEWNARDFFAKSGW